MVQHQRDCQETLSEDKAITTMAIGPYSSHPDSRAYFIQYEDGIGDWGGNVHARVAKYFRNNTYGWNPPRVARDRTSVLHHL